MLGTHFAGCLKLRHPEVVLEQFLCPQRAVELRKSRDCEKLVALGLSRD